MRAATGKFGRVAAIGLIAGMAVAVVPGWALAQQGPRPQQPGQAAPTTPPIVPDVRTRDMGTMNPQEVAQTAFMLTNRSTQPVRIRELRANCNCTRLIPESMTIPARGSIRMDVTIDLRGDLGQVRKNGLIYFEGFDRPIEIEVTGQLQYPLQVASAPLRTSTTHVTTQLRSSMGRPVRLLSVHGAEPTVLSQTPQGSDRILAATVRHDFGTLEDVAHALLVVTDEPSVPLAAMRISAGRSSQLEMPFFRMMSQLNISHKFFNMGVLKKGEAKTFTTTVFRDNHNEPLRAWIPIEGLSVEIVKVEPDPGQTQWPKAQSVTFTVTSTIERAGATLYAPLYIESGSEEKPTALNRVWAAGLTADASGNYIEAIEKDGPVLMSGDGGAEALARVGQ